jgi:hypothetical protein
VGAAQHDDQKNAINASLFLSIFLSNNNNNNVIFSQKMKQTKVCTILALASQCFFTSEKLMVKLLNSEQYS